MLVATPIFANDADVTVTVSDITVTGDNQQGGQATASGTVTVTSTASDTSGNPKIAYSAGEAEYSVTAPDETLLASASTHDADMDVNFGRHAADASSTSTVVLPWSYPFVGNQLGDYTFTQSGAGLAGYLGSWPDFSTKTVTKVWKVVPRRTLTQLGWEWGPAQNKFSIWCGGIYSYNWSDGHSTLPVINLTTTAWWNGTQTTLKFVIQEGTVVTGDYCLRALATPSGVQLSTLNGGKMTFSNPVVISKLVDGKWIEVASITSL